MIKRFYKITFRVLLIGVLFFLGSNFSAYSQADTTISDDEFTEIVADTTSVDTLSESGTAVVQDSVVSDTVTKSDVKVTSPKEEVKKTLWQTFLAGLAGGFLAFFMPCIFPMVPLTVSYFTKRAGSRQKGIGQAMIYGLSIIVIYVAFGLLITVLFGSAGLSAFSSSGLFNFFFFLVLVVFAISFFGAFEITLPSAFVNKIDQKADTSKGLGGIFFMAASLALVSFSCTGPIIGTLLVEASSKGTLLGPAIGMFGFALALALPFTISAIFPGFLTSMPKSGGWLNSVKVCLGFLELAFALKFLSAADLVWHWEWFDREVFLVLWIVIFILMGFYLLGKLKFSHDSELPFISVPRLFLAIFSFAFSIYMIPGLWGAPVSVLSGLAPPMNTQDFILTPGGGSASNHDADFPDSVKYGTVFKNPIGFKPFFDLEEGLAYAKKVNKPIMIDFTGWACVNCRRMEDDVWVKPEIGKLIKEYVLIQLYVDERGIKMPKDKIRYSEILRHKTDDLGWWNGAFQAEKYNTNSQPFYVLAGHDLKPLVTPQGAVFNPEAYGAYLQSGLDAYASQK